MKTEVFIFMLFAIMSVSLISCGDDDEIGGRDTLVVNGNALGRKDMKVCK